MCRSKSVRLNTALAVSGLTPLLVGRLDHKDAIARLLLLKMIKVSTISLKVLVTVLMRLRVNDVSLL